MVIEFDKLINKGDLVSIFNWVVWDSLILITAIFFMYMCVRIQELRIFEKSKLYKILF